MQVLIAHGSEVSRRAFRKALAGGDYDVIEAADGSSALEILMPANGPRLALVDWDLPELEGPELCRLVRDFRLTSPPYMILATPAGAQRDITVGLEAGANDFVTTPASPDELHARVDYGRGLVELPWGQKAMHAPATARVGAKERADARDAMIRLLQEDLAW